MEPFTFIGSQENVPEACSPLCSLNTGLRHGSLDGTGAGAVLLQGGDEGLLRPVCFFSRKFNQHQANYSVIEKEALGLILALQHFEVYVGGTAPLIV